MKTAVHHNSIQSYHGLDLTKRQQEVVKALLVLGEATDQMIADYLNYGINRVTGRITELRNKGVVVESKNIDGEYGKKVRVCRLAEYKEGLFE